MNLTSKIFGSLICPMLAEKHCRIVNNIISCCVNFEADGKQAWQDFDGLSRRLHLHLVLRLDSMRQMAINGVERATYMDVCDRL